MKTKKSRHARNSAAIHRITRNTAVNERRRRISLWQFYRTSDVEIQPRAPDVLLTEPSSR